MQKRLLLVFAFFIIVFIAIVLRLFYWQVISSEVLSGASAEQLIRNKGINPKRGIIYTSDNSPLVVNKPVFLVFAQPPYISDETKTIKELSGLLNMEEASLSSKFLNVKAQWIPLAEKITKDTVEKISEKNLKGIGFSEESIRFYPESSMAAHLLGFVGKNQNGVSTGYFGLEGYYNEQLTGKPGFIKEEKDAFGNPILAGVRQVISPIDGYNIHLTIDKTVQYIIEKKLSDAIVKYGAASGTVTVMNPKTGEIKGMASLPSYDPYNRLDYATDLYKNPVINSSYEPGSTFKILVMAAALNEKKISPSDTYNEDGPIQIGQYNIKTWNNQYHGEIKMAEILQYSSNPGMVYIAEKLGKDSLISYLKKLGFGQLTGIDLQDEATPEIRPEDRWYEIDYATASFGQGIAVTPLQMIRMGATIANGGKLITPHIVSKITDSVGNTITSFKTDEKIIFKKEVASIVTEMMTQAVEKGETRFLKPIGIRIAGKTGTAQIPIAGHYDTQKTIASFIGFFPADNPQIIILTTLREPTSSPWGSETAAPLFFAIAKELIAYYNIPLNF